MTQNDFAAVAAHGRSEGVFARLVAAAVPLLPHAEALLAVTSADGTRIRRAVNTRDGAVDLPPHIERWLLEDAGHSRIGKRVPDSDECRAWMKTPVFLSGRVAGVLVFFARPGNEYGESDLPRAQALAEMVMTTAGSGGVGDLFEEAAGDRDPILDPSEEVLRELSGVIDFRSVFPRVSEIVGRVLPHDRLTITFHDQEGYVGLQVTSDNKPLEFTRVRVAREVLARPFVLFPELSEEALADYQPVEAKGALLRAGFRSFLAINLNAGSQRMGVEFWSYRFNGFTLANVPLARHVASCLALAVSHEQLVEAHDARVRDHQAARAEARVGVLLAELGRPNRHRRIAGQSKAWTAVLHAASRVAETDATVLLLGESGTGKEVVARLIHEVSDRHHRPFIAVNCAALPEQLLESELFGYERGAFSGATHAKPGQIELAEGGVLFLDEVSEMSMAAQAKFLRVLQEREYRRLGGTRLMTADIRVIAATNTDLQGAIQKGLFRRDLYYRLRVFDVQLPPLRERRDDILPLAEVLLEEIAERLGHRRPPRLTPAARAALTGRDWPGNVRELRNVLERASILCDGDLLDVAHFSFDPEGFDVSPTTDLHLVEREMIEKVLRECGGNKSAAAKRLGLSRMQLYVRLRRYQGLEVN